MKINQTCNRIYSTKNGYWMVSTLPLIRSYKPHSMVSYYTLYVNLHSAIDFKHHKHGHRNKKVTCESSIQVEYISK